MPSTRCDRYGYKMESFQSYVERLKIENRTLNQRDGELLSFFYMANMLCRLFNGFYFKNSK